MGDSASHECTVGPASSGALREPHFIPPTRRIHCLVEHKKDLIHFEHPGFLVHCGKVGMWYLVGDCVSPCIVGKVKVRP